MIHRIHENRDEGVTLSELKEAYPAVSREILYDLLVRWRFVWRTRWGLPDALTWKEPGFVWAMDFTHPDEPVDGIFGRLLVVRDLGSGCVLFARPVRRESASEARLALWSLFTLFGPPLVLKSDNGSAFSAHATRRLIRRHGVLLLLSPPRRPSYNGACEAGNGALKTYIRAILSVSGGPMRWTSSAVECARLFANDRPRESGDPASTPALRFSARAPVRRELRARFLYLYRRLQGDVRLERNLPLEARLGPRAQAAVDRSAIRRALETLGILHIERRRIRPE